MMQPRHSIPTRYYDRKQKIVVLDPACIFDHYIQTPSQFGLDAFLLLFPTPALAFFAPLWSPYKTTPGITVEGMTLNSFVVVYYRPLVSAELV